MTMADDSSSLHPANAESPWMPLHQWAVSMALCMAALAGCASYGPGDRLDRGTTLAQAEQQMGARTGLYPLPGGGQRAEFARGPFGKHTYMLDYDAGGQLVAWNQVLTEENFTRIVPGMKQDEVLLAIGHPSNSSYLSYQKRALW
jgi:hypothetical protein